MSGSDGKVARLEVPQVEVSEVLLELAGELKALAAAIEAGQVRAAAFCYVESGPDMNVNSQWASQSGRITLTGGLHRLLQSVSAA